MMTKTQPMKNNHYFRTLVALVLATSLLVVSGARPAEAAFPGKNGKIVFASNQTTGAGVSNPEGDFEIFTMNPDGTGLKQLTRNTTSDDRPAFSPDGKKIAFDSNRNGNQEVFVMNAGGTQQINLTKNAQTDFDPTFSPDGKKIAFTSGRAGNGLDVFVMNADGSSPTNLTNNPASDSAPTFSPDGQKIAFQTSRAGDSDIFLMGADGSNPTDLTFGTAFDFDPAFSPDGKTVAFSSNRDGDFDIFVITTDGSSRSRLTGDTAVDKQPAFSPDGKKIALMSGTLGNDEVFVMGLDGSNQTNLTNNAAVDVAPDWQPLSSTFTVNSVGDGADSIPGDGGCDAGGSASSQCTLRAAIQEANATLGHDTIKFNIAGTGVYTIAVGSSGLGSLPNITDPVTIDGYTQPGSSPNTLAKGTNAVLTVELDQSGPGGDGLRINPSAANSVIRGLIVNRSRFQNGIFVSGDGSRIEGNFIGTDSTGTQDLGNNRNGVQILGASNVTVGGTAPAARNLISGNNDDGVQIIGTQARKGSLNRMLGNLIGTDRTGTKDLGNSAGVLISESANNVIGDGSSFGSNTIAFNGAGVDVISGSDTNSSNGNLIARNSIFSNDGLGIDLFSQFGGVTTNDTGDFDSGANRLQNFPVLESAKTVSGKTTIAGSLEGVRSETFTIQFYSNPPDTNEGKTFIGDKTITTSVDGLRSFTFSPATAVATGRTITATATRGSTGDTSEFSAPKKVTLATTSNLAPDTTKVSGPSGLTKSPSAHFKFDSTDREATFECSLDGGAYHECSSPENVHGLSEGRHTFEVRAKKAGNVDPSPAAWNWAVDRKK